MASDPYVRQAAGVFTGTVGSTALTAGDAVYFDGTDWEKADADDNTKAAEAIAVNSVSSGEKGIFCRSCVIVDIDAPYTQGDQYFLSTTAGALTATRPTGANNLKQVIGFALSTSELYVNIPVQYELHDYQQFTATTGGTDAQLDSGNFGSKAIDAQNDDAYLTVQVPENAVGLEIAYMWLAAEASVGTPTFDMFVSGAIDGEQWDATTQDTGIANSAGEGAAADEIQRTDVSAGFDDAGIVEAGNIIGVRVTKDDTGTDSQNCFGIMFVWKCV